jgi:hypothetical protein
VPPARALCDAPSPIITTPFCNSFVEKLCLRFSRNCSRRGLDTPMAVLPAVKVVSSVVQEEAKYRHRVTRLAGPPDQRHQHRGQFFRLCVDRASATIDPRSAAPEPGIGRRPTRNLLKNLPFFPRFHAGGIRSYCVTISTRLRSYRRPRSPCITLTLDILTSTSTGCLIASVIGVTGRKMRFGRMVFE